MSGSDKKLTAKQEAFLATLLTVPTLAQAARRAKISEPTARRWLAQPAVRAAWLDMRRQVIDQAMTIAQIATRAAVTTLLDCLKPTYAAGVRVRAATTILDTAMRAVEIDDLAARIEQLEKALEEQRETQSQQRQRTGVRRFA